MCQLCKERKADDIHHVAGKLGGLLTYEPLWKLLCRGCHEWVHNNIEKARKLGFICEKGNWNNKKLIKSGQTDNCDILC
jgi:hypothetical protein